MSRIQFTWVIKNKSGQLKGPYSTEAIMKMISEGVFSGQEMISKQPGGEWQKISREPEFYDKLLEALEGVVQVDPKKGQRMEAETVIQIPAVIREDKNIDRTKTEKKETPKPHKVDLYQISADYIQPAAKTPGSVSVNSAKVAPVIELKNIANAEQSELRKRILLPGIILVLALLLVVFAFMEDSPTSADKISLLAPSKATASLGVGEVQTRLAEAVKLIESDTFENYLAAQNKLVSIVEGSPMNIEVRSLLCVVYNELWPYSRQDAQDIRTISMMTQQTRAINVVSPFGQVCETIKLLTGGRYKEARGAVETALDESDRFSLLPVLYSYKAELLGGDRDYNNAIPYFEKAIQLWPQWLQPSVSLAQIQYRKGDLATAIQILNDVSTKNPKHKEARVLQGIYEYRGYKKSDSAFTHLSSSLNNSNKIPSSVESEGLAVLAELYIMRGEKSNALDAAQKAYALNPNNSDLKNLVVRLGGSESLKSKRAGNGELLYLGDQYVRQGDYLAAQAEYKAAFEADPKNGSAAMRAAKALWYLNQSFEAISWLNKAIQAEPKLISAYVLQADYLSQRYDFNGAVKSLSTAMKISPNNHEVLRGMAQLEFRKNNMAAAINYGMRASKIYDGDIETFILLSNANANFSKSIVPINKKEIERKENAAKDAIRYGTKAVEIDSTNPEAQINYAKMLAQVNGVDSALTYLNELIKRYSYTIDYRIALAEVYKMEDRYNQSMRIYEQIIETDSRNKKALLGLGESQKAIGLNNKALRSFLAAAVVDPTDGEALFQAGKLYLEIGKFDEAIAQFQRVQRLNEHFPNTHYYIGKAAFASGDFTLAMDSARAEKKRNPNMADSYILAAEVHVAKKQFNECASEYATAMKLRPQGAEIYVKSAQCYRQSGSLDVAEDMLALASARESGYAEIYREQGAVYEVKGDARSAAQAYNKYLGLSPNAPDRAQIESKLLQLEN